MRKFLSLLLSVALLLSGCAFPVVNSDTTTSQQETTQVNQPTENITASFTALDDPALLQYAESAVYDELITALDSEAYFIENVSAIYYSKEYMQEVAYNSQANIYFGFALAELDEYFQDTKYVFTLGEDGQTTVQPVKAYENIYEQAIKNVAIGTGVILLCVTVSVATYTAAPAVSVIFAMSALDGTTVALSTGVISALVAGIVTGVETKNFDEAMETAVLAGSEGFKWGAFCGVIEGGLTEAIALKGASLNGLTMNQAALIQRESHLPLSFIKSFHSMDEYEVYKNAGLQLSNVNGKLAYTQKIDWSLIDDKGRTNADRIVEGLNPIDNLGNSFELHHIGQKSDSPLAILTQSQHRDHYSTLHSNTGSAAGKVDHGASWSAQKQQFWLDLLEQAPIIP